MAWIGGPLKHRSVGTSGCSCVETLDVIPSLIAVKLILLVKVLKTLYEVLFPIIIIIIKRKLIGHCTDRNKKSYYSLLKYMNPIATM